MKGILLIACLSGCGGWGYGEGVTPVGDPDWEGQVAEAVGIWNYSLEAKCGSPAFFMEDECGHPVSKLTLKQWLDKYPDKPISVGGWYDDWDQTIDVRAQPNWPESERATLVHELGHALGLRHVDPKDDPASVMLKDTGPENYIPSLKDVANVECP